MRLANGYECFECGEVERDPELVASGQEPQCQACDSYNTALRAIEDCDDDACDVDTHDYGAGWHVETV